MEISEQEVCEQLTWRSRDFHDQAINKGGCVYDPKGLTDSLSESNCTGSDVRPPPDITTLNQATSIAEHVEHGSADSPNQVIFQLTPSEQTGLSWSAFLIVAAPLVFIQAQPAMKKLYPFLLQQLLLPAGIRAIADLTLRIDYSVPRYILRACGQCISH